MEIILPFSPKLNVTLNTLRCYGSIHGNLHLPLFCIGAVQSARLNDQAPERLTESSPQSFWNTLQKKVSALHHFFVALWVKVLEGGRPIGEAAVPLTQRLLSEEQKVERVGRVEEVWRSSSINNKAEPPPKLVIRASLPTSIPVNPSQVDGGEVGGHFPTDILLNPFTYIPRRKLSGTIPTSPRVPVKKSPQLFSFQVNRKVVRPRRMGVRKA